MFMLGAYQGRHDLAKKFEARRRLDSREPGEVGATPGASPPDARVDALTSEDRRAAPGRIVPAVIIGPARACSAQDGVPAVHRDGGARDEVRGGTRQEDGDA